MTAPPSRAGYLVGFLAVMLGLAVMLAAAAVAIAAALWAAGVVNGAQAVWLSPFIAVALYVVLRRFVHTGRGRR